MTKSVVSKNIINMANDNASATVSNYIIKLHTLLQYFMYSGCITASKWYRQDLQDMWRNKKCYCFSHIKIISYNLFFKLC